MTEHKFTDEDVIKALESCQESACLVCPYNVVYAVCRDVMCGDVLDLINRQREEIEIIKETAAEIRYEAIKEFADRLKTYYKNLDSTVGAAVVYFADQVVKEMTGSTPRVIHKDYFTPKKSENDE